MFGEEGVKKLKAADENLVGNEGIDAIGKGPVAFITKEMKQGAMIMREFMTYQKQVELTGKANLNGFADQFPEERKVAARLGQKIGG